MMTGGELEEVPAALVGEGLHNPAAKRPFEDAFPSKTNGDAKKIWNQPGGPGDCVFRLIVPLQKVGGIIGRKGEFVKRMCEETKSRIKILDGVDGTTERVVMVSAREDFESPVNAAMEGFLQIHRRVAQITLETDGQPDLGPGSTQELKGNLTSKMLVPASQAGSLIGRQGANIRAIQEESSANIRVLSPEELPLCALVEDRVVEITGDYANVHKAIELVIRHLRKFLVDRSVLPLFELNRTLPGHMQRSTVLPTAQNGSMPVDAPYPGAPPPWQPARAPEVDPYAAPPVQQQYGAAPLPQGGYYPPAGYDYSAQARPPPVYEARPAAYEVQPARPTYGYEMVQPRQPEYDVGPRPTGVQPRDVLSLYGKDPGPLGGAAAKQEVPAIYTVSHKMQVDLRYAESIIGEKGVIINYVRTESGANVTISETPGSRDQMTVEIKGLDQQVKVARAIIEEAIKRGNPAQQQQPAAPPPAQLQYAPVAAAQPPQPTTYSTYPPATYSTEAYDPYKVVANSVPGPDKTAAYQTYGRPVEQAPRAWM
eukprot:TRINITY_DN1062_c0_g2_i1.p1 TRINITY_DN1062_c0_g2~~TRINITY_DN1062_c0_g2_i1.p1  ORF type:complete len:539 (+),score=94.40 TRINITY_DN1062_c0_g2_i1:109-1725(+)